MNYALDFGFYACSILGAIILFTSVDSTNYTNHRRALVGLIVVIGALIFPCIKSWIA